MQAHLSVSQSMYPCVLEHYCTFLELIQGKCLAVFLDYDGEPGAVGARRYLLRSNCAHHRRGLPCRHAGADREEPRRGLHV